MRFMDIKTNKLVEEFTLQVITSRDPEHALMTVYQFFKKHFPLNLLNIPIYDSSHGTLHYWAAITDEGVMLVDEKVKLSTAGQKYALESLNIRIQNIAHTGRNPVTIDTAEHFAIKESNSTLFVSTKLNASRYGIFGLVAWGLGRYKKKHVQLMENLFEPVTGTLRHILRQLEISSQKKRLVTENQELRKRLGYRIVGEESGLQEVMSHVDRVAALDIPVLLMGETGVGKEIVATSIHQRSNRTAGPLISFNCGAIPDTLLESELFGYEKGAFTGASEMKYGYFEQADGGTVFMDEIGELSLKAQVKLLRFLQTMEFQRVGGKRPIAIDVRVVAATNRDLDTMVNEGRFRKDLWYRLNVFPIHIPPLRERKSDIPELALYFARSKSNEMNLPYDFNFAPESMEQLQAYQWPGNVRELQNVIERGLIISRGEPLSFSELAETRTRAQEEKPFSTSTHFPTMDELMSQHIRKSLILSKGKIEGPGGAAELLSLNPSTLRGRMRKLGIKINRMPS